MCHYATHSLRRISKEKMHLWKFFRVLRLSMLYTRCQSCWEKKAILCKFMSSCLYTVAHAPAMSSGYIGDWLVSVIQLLTRIIRVLTLYEWVNIPMIHYLSGLNILWTKHDRNHWTLLGIQHWEHMIMLKSNVFSAYQGFQCQQPKWKCLCICMQVCSSFLSAHFSNFFKTARCRVFPYAYTWGHAYVLKFKAVLYFMIFLFFWVTVLLMIYHWTLQPQSWKWKIHFY